jgi:hypothetical protein
MQIEKRRRCISYERAKINGALSQLILRFSLSFLKQSGAFFSFFAHQEQLLTTEPAKDSDKNLFDA